MLTASLAACGDQNQNTEKQQVTISKSPSAGIEVGTHTLSLDLNIRSALAAGISASNAKVTITKGELERTQPLILQLQELKWASTLLKPKTPQNKTEKELISAPVSSCLRITLKPE